MNEYIAVCSRQQAEQLVHYDHHHVRINSRLGIMLTYHWMPLEDSAEPLLLKVVFHDSARQHPPAPQGIQEIVGQLKLMPEIKESTNDGESLGTNSG
jgi:hypothetical protein